MESVSDIRHPGAGKFGAVVRVLFYRWFSVMVLLYGLLGFLFYLFLLLSNSGGATIELPFRELSKDTLWIWMIVFTVLHFAVFSGGILLLLFNKVWGFTFFFAGMLSILLANAFINNEINYTSWAVILIIAFVLWKWRKQNMAKKVKSASLP